MMWLDVAGGVCILLGALLCGVAAVGLHRMPDALGRMHAASKAQTLGVALAAVGLALVLRDPAVSGMLVLVAILQMLTAPVASQMMARSAYRTRQYREDTLEIVDGADRPVRDDEEPLDDDPGDRSEAQP